MGKKEAVSLSTMLGEGDFWNVKGKDYIVKPIKIKDEPEFTRDEINFGAQYFSLIDQKQREKFNKWMERYLFSKEGEPMNLEKVSEADWDISDLKEFWKRLVGISG
jgi:hypothetical protein